MCIVHIYNVYIFVHNTLLAWVYEEFFTLQRLSAKILALAKKEEQCSKRIKEREDVQTSARRVKEYRVCVFIWYFDRLIV